MRKRAAIGVISAGILLLGMLGVSGSQTPQQSHIQTNEVTSQAKNTPVKTISTCDGTSVTSNCSLDSVSYKTYIYHAAVPEKSHNETVTTYHQEVTRYCTLCNDGTYSPSCATGRGACSYHNGVAQWNAPIVSNVPTTNTKSVIDTPAQDAYYEKITE
jgi:hypothetical protein